VSIFLKSAWVVIVLGGIALGWWFFDGPWQVPGESLLEHDIVRFGPVPLLISGVWLLMVLITFSVSSHLNHRKRQGSKYPL